MSEEPLEAGGRQPQDSERPGGKGAAEGNAPDNIAQDAERIRQALSQEVAAGRVEVAATNTRVTVQFNAAENASAAERIQAAQAVASGIKKLNELTPQLTSEVAVTGATSTLVPRSKRKRRPLRQHDWRSGRWRQQQGKDRTSSEGSRASLCG